jgi:hypothetical protein
MPQRRCRHSALDADVVHEDRHTITVSRETLTDRDRGFAQQIHEYRTDGKPSTPAPYALPGHRWGISMFHVKQRVPCGVA